MKKLLTFLSFLCMTIGAMADNYWTVPSLYEHFAYSTVVYAKFVTNENVNMDAYEVAAFVGDETEPRAIATPSYNQQTASYLVTLRVPGNQVPDQGTDDGKAISFRVYNSATNMEYSLACADEIEWIANGNAVRTTLTLTATTAITLDPISITMDEKATLADYLKVQPDGASLPLNAAVQWSLGNYASFATIENGILTPVKPTGSTSVTYMAAVGRLTARGQLNIYAPARSIAINEPYAITYRVGNREDVAALAELLTVGPSNTHYTVDPSNTTDVVSWQYEDPNQTVIGYGADGALALLQPGTVKLRPIVTTATGVVLTPSNPEWITITVVQPVEEVILNWRQGYAFMANVGDDVYNRLASRVEIKPENATNKGFSFKITPLQGEQVADGEISQDGSHLTFNQAGQYTLSVIPDDNPDYTGNQNSVSVYVENPAKDISFSEDPLIIMKNDETTAETIARSINANIKLADGYSYHSGTISITGAITGGGDLTDNGAMATVSSFQDGTATVSVTMNWNDYSRYDGTDQSLIVAQSNPFTFTVRVSSQLAGFTVVHTPGINGQGELAFVPIPENAQFDFNDIRVNVNMGGYPDDWTVIATNRENSTSGNTFVITYDAVLPGHVSVDAGDQYTLYDGAKVEFTGFDVPATYNFFAGWQWRTNSYGDVSGTQTDEFFNNTFLNSFAEARTQTDLLINDAEWGLFGSLYDLGIPQGDCYKIRMEDACGTTLTVGSFRGDNSRVELFKGWTWVGCPYVYDRTFDEAFGTQNLFLPAGTRIVSKNDGFAVWNNGSWTGNLNKLKKNEGYLIYCPEANGNGAFSLSFNAEQAMTQPADDASGARMASKSVWSYDHSLFANNMSMIAELKNVDEASHYTIGAFVDGECRGEGVVIDGRAFITVHGNTGEDVSFRLHNELTGEFFDVAETVKSQAMLGTISAPVALTAPAITTGISRVTNAEQQAESYDLLGRKTVNSKITLRRMADGTVRKVMRK